jgi:hypothetical protein
MYRESQDVVPQVDGEGMGSPFVRALRSRRLDLVAELEQLRRELADLSNRIGLREGQLRNLDELLALEGEGAGSPGPSGPSPVTASPPASRSAPFLAVAAEVLGTKGKPIHYRELADLVTSKGAYIPGRDPAANLLTRMSQDSRFRRFERGTYGLQHWAGGVAEVTSRKTRRRRRKRG